MVKTLVLVRHGAPEAAAASGKDIDRKLTTAGVRALRTAYPRVFSLLGDDPKVQVWSSPAVRALETADVVAAATGVDDIEVHESLYAQDAAAFLAELDQADVPCVIAVGHAPFVDNLATRLLGTCPPLGKGAAIAIDLAAGFSGRGVLRWYVCGPEATSWEKLAVVEHAVAGAVRDLSARADAFLAGPESAEALLQFRVALRRVRSLLQFLAPWQTKKQNRRCEHAIKELQVASARLRALDILSETVAGLVESGELGENSLLPMSCAKERSLECASLLTLMRKRHSAKELGKIAHELAHHFKVGIAPGHQRAYAARVIHGLVFQRREAIVKHQILFRAAGPLLTQQQPVIRLLRVEKSQTEIQYAERQINVQVIHIAILTLRITVSSRSVAVKLFAAGRRSIGASGEIVRDVQFRQHSEHF